MPIRVKSASASGSNKGQIDGDRLIGFLYMNSLLSNGGREIFVTGLRRFHDDVARAGDGDYGTR